MDSIVASALISAAITSVGVIFGQIRWRRDLQIKLEGLRDEVATELIRQRTSAYSDFFLKLEPMSTIHRAKIEQNHHLALNFMKIFQEATYSPVGLFASSDTREIMVYARLGCKLYADEKITYDEWLQRIWAVHYALRSDLGISQPNWPSEIERLRQKVIAQSSHSIIEQVETTKHLKYDEKPNQ